jgi:ABC-type nickel/cobalt efflux system permease component RcnA
MKKIIMLAMVSVMMLVSLGGCWVGWDEGGRDGRDRGHERDRGHDKDEGHDRDGGHEERH